MGENTGNQDQKTLPPGIPLSVLLFHAAMEKDVGLSEFARQIGISALSLRQFIANKSQRPRGRTLELIGEALGISEEEVRRRAALPITSAPRFRDWLKTLVRERRISRSRLNQETRISDGALRNYLNGQTLPDSNQARRLAQSLEVNFLEFARVLVADHVVRNGGKVVAPSGQEQNTTFGLGDRGEEGTTEWGSRSWAPSTADEEHMLSLWRKLHPQGRRATLLYIAGLLTER